MNDYSIFEKFMSRWTKSERQQFELIQDLHYPEKCHFVDMFNFFLDNGVDSYVYEVGPAMLTREAASILLEDRNYGPNFYEEFDAHGSKRCGKDAWKGDIFSGEIDEESL